jgi:hypothetical protein
MRLDADEVAGSDRTDLLDGQPATERGWMSGT